MKKRKFLQVLAAVITAMALAGCSADKPSESNGSETSVDSSSSSSSGSSLASSSGDNSSDTASSENSGSGDTSSGGTESSISSSLGASSGSTGSNSGSSSQTGGSSSSKASSSKSDEGLSVSIIPEATQTARVEGDRIIFSVENIFSTNEYYRVDISGAKCENQSAAVGDDTTYINGVLYGDFRLDLYKQGVFIDTLKINVPRDDSFLILENASVGKEYGCSLMSHKRDFSTDKYPDMIRLEFFHQRGTAVPQYARYFAVFDNKIQELKIYENGSEVSPVGTFLTMRGDGLMTQNLTIETSYQHYNVIKYEYRFNLEQRRLDRKKVNFTGWDN